MDNSHSAARLAAVQENEKFPLCRLGCVTRRELSIGVKRDARTTLDDCKSGQPTKMGESLIGGPRLIGKLGCGVLFCLHTRKFPTVCLP